MGMKMSSRVSVQGPIPRRKGSAVEAKELAEALAEQEKEEAMRDGDAANENENQVGSRTPFSSQGIVVPAGSRIVHTRARIRRNSDQPALSGVEPASDFRHRHRRSSFADNAPISSRHPSYGGAEQHWSKHPYLVRDPGLFEALVRAKIRPNPAIGPAELIVKVASQCGAKCPQFPHLDYFAIRMLHKAKEAQVVEMLRARDNAANSLLMIATHQHSKALVSFLLAKHANKLDMDERNKFGQTALHIAITGVKERYHKDSEMSLYFVEMLLRHGADANVVDSTMNTPLHYAAVTGDSASLAVLLL
jgi:hypothetical protein